ncbi:MAG: hypothetical protein AB7J32_12210 [Pseudonocardia sp.]
MTRETTSALHRLRRAYRTARNDRADARRRADRADARRRADRADARCRADRAAVAGRGYLITDVDVLSDSGEPPIGDGYLYVPNVHAARG